MEMSQQQGRPRVVVIGGGFAGLQAVRALKGADVDVLLVDQAPYTTFQPLLYQVATGGLNPGDVTYALRAFAGKYPNARFRRATVVGIDADEQTVHLEGGAEVGYDYLIVGSGVTANYFGIPGAAEDSMTIYRPGAAVEVRDRMVANIEAVAEGHSNAVEPMIVIVGAGPTGVEMAGALAELRNVAVPHLYPELAVDRVRVVLVEMTPHVLGPFAEGLRGYAAKELRDRGVELRLGTAVKEVRPDRVVLDDDSTLPSAATIWATGVKAPDEMSTWGFPQGRGGRIRSEHDLRVEGHHNVFAVGDVAVNEVKPLPQLAQPAMQGGRHAGLQVRRLVAGDVTEPFRYHDKGMLATIGRADAVAQFPRGFKLKGVIAWLMWMGVHIIMLMSNRNRLASLVNLSVRYFSWPKGVNSIVGDVPTTMQSSIASKTEQEKRVSR
jgi:NADH:ubiquinone reductase (H+-translocating)